MKEEKIILEELKAGTKDLEWFSKNFSKLKKNIQKNLLR